MQLSKLKLIVKTLFSCHVAALLSQLDSDFCPRECFEMCALAMTH